MSCLSLFSRGGVEHVDEDEAEGDEEDDPSGHNVGRDEEGDPGHGDEHGGGQVDGEDEGAEGPRQLHLEAIDRVVAWRDGSSLSFRPCNYSISKAMISLWSYWMIH